MTIIRFDEIILFIRFPIFFFFCLMNLVNIIRVLADAMTIQSDNRRYPTRHMFDIGYTGRNTNLRIRQTFQYRNMYTGLSLCDSNKLSLLTLRGQSSFYRHRIMQSETIHSYCCVIFDLV